MTQNRLHHLGWHYGIEVFEAAFSDQTFGRHAHEGFAIGAIAEGAGGYFCRGESMVLPAGLLSLMNPEEAHTGHAVADSVRYTMVYVPETAVRDLLGLTRIRGFAAVTPPDRDLVVSRALRRLAARLDAPGGADWRIGVEEAIQAVLARAFALHGRARLRVAGREPARVALTRERIAAAVEAGESVTIADLAATAGLDPSYFIRSYSRATGLTPHAEVVRRRIGLARRLLLDGMPAAQAAIAAGFFDQAHLIRQFRRHYGVTPGAVIRH